MVDSHYISFPGLGIEPFKVNKFVTFGDKTLKIFSKEIAWYGVIICVGIILAFFYGEWRAKKKEGIKSDDYLDLAICLIPISVICARLYFVIFYWSKGNYQSFIDVIAIWKGGLAIYGGIIGGFATILVFSKIKKIKAYKLLDAIAPGVMIGQLIGRWGNFTNAEAYGNVGNVMGLPWRMGIADSENGITSYYHPTFLYESLWNLIGFVIANILYKKKKFDGQIFYFYIAWYGFGRGFIELLREDSLKLGSIRVSSLLGFTCFIVGTVLYILSAKKARVKALADGEYENQFENANDAEPEAEENKDGEQAKAEGDTGETESPDKDEKSDTIYNKEEK